MIGLEVHCELRTATKLFCGCRNEFGVAPNTNICPVCLGLPGSLPVLNQMAVEYAMRIGLALHCQVEPSIFHRKNYFYPDMPKDYQVSQYDQPINIDGWLDLPGGQRSASSGPTWRRTRARRPMSGGGGRIHDAGYSLVDYNRAGVPLVEIVSRPDLRSAGRRPGLCRRAAGDPGRHRRVGREDGGGLASRRRQRLGPPRRVAPSWAPAARSRT